jgi:hypothetical protein
MARQVSLAGGRQGDGSTGKIVNSSVPYVGGAFSFSFWFKPVAAPYLLGAGITPEIELVNGYTGVVGGFQWDATLNLATFYFTYKNNNGYYVTGNLQLPSSYWNAMVGIWNHIALVYSGSHYYIYLNGAQVASGKPSDWADGSAGGYSGSFDVLYSSTYGNYAPDSMSEVAYYKCALTGTDITNLANGGYRASDIEPSSLILYWKFEGQSPEPDLSGNNYSGTVTDTTSVAGPSIRIS